MSNHDGREDHSTGFLFVIEGIDGTGKTTQAKKLEYRLEKKGYDPVRLHEPTNSKWGKKIRNLAIHGRSVDPREELNYFIEDRKIDVEEYIKPALSAGKVVILDRYYLSNVAYQGALGIDPEEIMELNDFAPRPDLILILDVAPEIGLSRINDRENGKPNYFEDPEYLTEVRKIFRWIERNLGNAQIIDATPPVEDVTKRVWNVVHTYLKKNAGTTRPRSTNVP
ncbi:MAG: dTMP kinase [Candidatus Thorarchaeota archaeon]|nr:dTMP kinase [Candidatus Thorarchaeota archaeon]